MGVIKNNIIKLNIMKKKLTVIIVIIIVVIGAILINTSRPDTEGLRIGAIMSLTGDFGAVGENTLKGMKVAQEVYKKETGNQIELVVEDDGGDGAKGLSAYRKITTQDNVQGLVNFFTTTMDSIYEISEEAPYPIMMVAFQANNVGDDHVFQTTQGNDNVWDRFAEYIKGAELNESKVVVVHSIDAAQDSFAKEFVKQYGEPVEVVTASSDKNSLRTDAAKIAALDPTMVVFIMTPENGAILTKELLPLVGSDTQFIYDIQLTTGTSFYNDQLGGDLSKINGAIALGMEGELDSKEYKEFYNAYKEMYPNEEPGFLADYGYDTFMTYLNAYDPDESKWTENLKETKYKGASGDVQFDQNGIRIPPLVIKEVSNGGLTTVYRLPF
jgi:ABC-type branched-subunit amino acid transport system substrate-binding protein